MPIAALAISVVQTAVDYKPVTLHLAYLITTACALSVDAALIAARTDNHSRTISGYISEILAFCRIIPRIVLRGGRRPGIFRTFLAFVVGLHGLCLASKNCLPSASLCIASKYAERCLLLILLRMRRGDVWLLVEHHVSRIARA